MTTDAINPNHYTHGGMETIDFMRAKSTDAEFVAYCRLNAIKYLARAGMKGNAQEAEDFAKAAWYCQMAAHVSDGEHFSDPREAR